MVSRAASSRLALLASLGWSVGLSACSESTPAASQSEGASDEADAGDEGEADTGSGSAGEDAGGTGGDGDGDSGELPPIDPAICEGMEFSNLVDEASCDEIQGRGVEPQFADEVELCRRYSGDLLGRLPSQGDFSEDCEGRGNTAIVNDFMGRQSFIQQGRRVWADKMRMTSGTTYYEYLEELDLMVQELYAGDRTLFEMAELVPTHPGFLGRFDGDDLVGYSFQAFLGRDAAPHERAGLEPLWHMWMEEYYEQHPDYYFGYSLVVLNTILCMNSLEWACHSELWGHHSVVIPPLDNEDWDWGGPNVFDLDQLTPEQWEVLRLPGRLIREHPTFYEAAADELLTRYLGYEAGQQLPRVRQALADMLAESQGNLREATREILTSQLYTMAAEYPDPEGTSPEEGSPDFWHGPLKQLPAEVWLDTLSHLTGEDLGGCDPRFPNVTAGRPFDDSPWEDTVWHPSEYPKMEGWPETANAPDYSYRDMAWYLGGCPDQQAQLRFTGTGVMISIAYATIGDAVCSALTTDSPIAPPGLESADKSVESLRGILDHVYTTLTLRELPAELEEAASASIEGCRDDSECDATAFALHHCTSLFESAPVVFY